MALQTFQESYYLTKNPDVLAAVRDGLMTAEQHYIQYGELEGRQPNPYFNPTAYKDANPDVVLAVSSGAFSTFLDHFEQFGAAEYRSCGTNLFNEEFYLNKYEDVRLAVEAEPPVFRSGYEHYVLFGHDREGRLGSEVVLSSGDTFVLTPETAAGADVMHLTGDQTVRIDFTNPANQITGQDLNGDGVISLDGVENNVRGVAANFEIVDAYARNPLNQNDITNNFAGDIAFDGTGFAGDGVSTDGNIFLGGLGIDTAFGGIGNDFMAGGGVAAGRFVRTEDGLGVQDTKTGQVYLDGAFITPPGDTLFSGRNADFLFAELSQLSPVDGVNTLFDGGNTTDDSAAGLAEADSGVNSQNNDWILLEASDDDEPVTVNLGGGAITTRSGAAAELADIESLDASGNLYGFLNDVDVMLGARATDLRSVVDTSTDVTPDPTAPVDDTTPVVDDTVVTDDTAVTDTTTDTGADVGTAEADGAENYGIGSTAQLNVIGSLADNVVIGGYDNDRISGDNDGSVFDALGNIVFDGEDILFGGSLSYLLHNQNNPNLLNAEGGLDLNVSVVGTVTDGRDDIDGGANDDHIVFEMDGGNVTGNVDDGTTSGDLLKDTGDTLWMTDYTMGRLAGAVVADEATAQQATLEKLTEDSVVRIDLGNAFDPTKPADDGAEFVNYGGSNADTHDQTNYAADIDPVMMTDMESVIATGLGQIDFKAAGNNSPELSFNNQQNFAGINADLDLRGNDRDNTLYANTGVDTIEGREGDDNLSGGRSDDVFVVAFGDEVDTIHRQLDTDGDNIWNSTAGRNGDGFGQDFRAPKDADIDASHLIVDFESTDISLPEVAVSTFQITIGGEVFAVPDTTALAAANNAEELAAVVNAAFSAKSADVTATASGNVVIITDAQGREISDTISEGFLVGIVLSSGGSASATGTFQSGPVNVVEDDVLVIKSYEDRSVNLGDNQETTEISNAAAMVAHIVRDDAETDYNETNTVLAQKQEMLVRVSNVSSGDQIVLDINGKEYSYTVQTKETTEAAVRKLVDIIKNELDLNSGSGRVDADFGTTDAANFADKDGAGTDVAVLSLMQALGSPSQTFMDISATINNTLAGGAGGTIELHNQSNTYIDLVEFPGYDGNLNGSTVKFLGRGETSVSLLQTALDAGDTITGVDATLDTDTADNWINGDDLLIGGLGNDSITAGTGDDVVLVSQGTDTVDGGANVGILLGEKFVDVLQVEQATFGEGSNFTVELADTLGLNGAGTVTVGGTAAGVTTFNEIETVRVLENSRDTTLNVAALSDSVAAAIVDAPMGAEGLTVNLTREDDPLTPAINEGPVVTYTVDTNHNGDLVDATDYNGFVATQVYGAENLITGAANDTVNIDASQITANNRIELAGQQNNAKTFVEGADTVAYDHAFLDVLPQDLRPIVTLTVESEADTDTVVLRGGVLNQAVTTDTLVGVEKIDLDSAATGLTDDLDLSKIAGGVTVNYGLDVAVGETLGGGQPEDSVANVEANTLEAGGVAVTGNGLGNELLEITGIDQLETVTGSAGDDRVITSDDMDATAINARISDAEIGIETHLGGSDTPIANVGLFQFDLGAGDNDVLDYSQDTDHVAVVVATALESETTIEPDAVDRIISVDRPTGLADRVDYATNVERYFGGQADNIIDLSNATVATTIEFSVESDAAENEFAELNGAAADGVDLVRGAEVRDTTTSDLFAQFMDRTADNPTGAAFWNTIAGHQTLAETVLLTDLENDADHAFLLEGGENVVNYSELTMPVTAAVQHVVYDAVTDTGTQSVNVTATGSVTTDVATVTSADYLSGEKTLTVVGSDQNGDIVNLGGLDAADGATIDTYNLVDLEKGVVVEDLLDTDAKHGQSTVIYVKGFENISGSDSIDRLYGSNGVNDINGGLGNDWIIGRGGSSVTGGDVLTGGAGNDRFVYATATDSATEITATQNTQDTVNDFGTGDDVLVFNTTDAGAVNADALATTIADGGVEGAFQVQIDQNADKSFDDTVVNDVTDDDYSIIDTTGAMASTHVMMRVNQSVGQDIQHLDKFVGGLDGQYEVVYSSADQSNSLAQPDEFHRVTLDTAGAGVGNSADKFDLRAFNFGVIAAEDTGDKDGGINDTDRNDDGVADAIESILYSTPVTVNSLESVNNFFREGAEATGVARAIHVQLEPGTGDGDDFRVFVDANHDGNYSAADDLVFDLVDVQNAGALYTAGAQTDLYNDANVDGNGNGIFIFNDAQYNLWFTAAPVVPPAADSIVLPGDTVAAVTAGTADRVVLTAGTETIADVYTSAEPTQVTVTGFETGPDADVLELDLPEADGPTTLDLLDGVVVDADHTIGVIVNEITGDTIVNFGPNADGEVVTLTLAGVTDPSTVVVEVI
ncbi:hypothetical protein [Chromatium okenii]|uniref:hypothetical protein n=1 Tax=Chromatium okenii TaxID=61644 RepID=UPI0026EFB0E9|nr:hypothetical protein [Chromatium okenii]MBV5310680.1 hypothetical protein [Chromatium okenii]